MRMMGLGQPKDTHPVHKTTEPGQRRPADIQA
jgi:hypothetical protein